VRRFIAKLAALEPGDQLLEQIAERWPALSMPPGRVDRSTLEEKLRDAEAHLADLYEARYRRGEFDSSEDIVKYEASKGRLAEQRDAARDALAEFGPPPTFDLALLLKTELSSEAWPHLPLKRQRELLGLAISRVYVLPSEGRGWHATPAEDRVHPVWLNELDPHARET